MKGNTAPPVLMRSPVGDPGIEAEEQLAFFVERGCAFGQGFHLARPLPAGGVTELVRAR